MQILILWFPSTSASTPFEIMDSPPPHSSQVMIKELFTLHKTNTWYLVLWLNDTKLNWLVKDFLTSIIAKLFTKSHLLLRLMSDQRWDHQIRRTVRFLRTGQAQKWVNFHLLWKPSLGDNHKSPVQLPSAYGGRKPNPLSRWEATWVASKVFLPCVCLMLFQCGT